MIEGVLGSDVLGDVDELRGAHPKWTVVPTADGHFEVVHTESALNTSLGPQDFDFVVVFRLFTKSNWNESETIDPQDKGTLKASHFNRKKPTRLFIHGWNPDPLAPIFTEGLQNDAVDLNQVDLFIANRSVFSEGTTRRQFHPNRLEQWS